MRNGTNDANHRGIWFYLLWGHPELPDSTQIVVEIEVAHSSIHKKPKWHHKYCAASEPPGEINALSTVRALHIPNKLIREEFVLKCCMGVDVKWTVRTQRKWHHLGQNRFQWVDYDA